MSFKSDIKKFRVGAIVDAVALRKTVAIKLFGAIITDTPVGNPATWNVSKAQAAAITKAGYTGGSLRGNWQMVRNGSNRAELTRVDDSGSATRADMEAKVNGSNHKDYFSFFNNLPYGPTIEYDGHSNKKAPQGMVRKNVLRFQRLVAKEARRKRLL